MNTTDDANSDKPPPDKTFFFTILMLSFLPCAVFFLACSEDKIDIVSADAFVVFDFDETGSPAQRLSVFVEVSSNVRRLEYITVAHSKYSWTIESPLLLQSGTKMWGGNMHLEPPPNLKNIPKGPYSFECVDAAGNKAQGGFSVDYDDKFLSGGFSNSLFDGDQWIHRVAVYSEYAELLYFEEPMEEWNMDEKIFSYVEDSSFLRHIFENGTTVCLSPKILRVAF